MAISRSALTALTSLKLRLHTLHENLSWDDCIEREVMLCNLAHHGKGDP
jgi:hypothetical protein